jgi:hypothetical protein
MERSTDFFRLNARCGGSCIEIRTARKSRFLANRDWRRRLDHTSTRLAGVVGAHGAFERYRAGPDNVGSLSLEKAAEQALGSFCSIAALLSSALNMAY